MAERSRLAINRRRIGQKSKCFKTGDRAGHIALESKKRTDYRDEPRLFIHQHEYRRRKNAERIVACLHGPERTEEELELIVDEGVTIKDVIIEHPVYGDLTAAIRVSTRKEVKQFMDHINSTNAAYLSQLTGGVHLHTLSAPTKERIDQACQALDDAGILIKD